MKHSNRRQKEKKSKEKAQSEINSQWLVTIMNICKELYVLLKRHIKYNDFSQYWN